MASIGPTTEVPLLSGARLTLARELNSGASYAKLLTFMPLFLQELEDKPAETQPCRLRKTKQMLNPPYGPAYSGACGMIFHSIPEDVLMSLIKGTVTYDIHNNSITPYNPDGPGVYALGLKIQERNGRFLNADEYKILLDNLQRYIKIARRMLNAIPLLQPELDFVDSVQSQIGEWDKQECRFINSGSNLANAELLLESLRKRYNALKAKDPSGQIYSTQSPLYVGCSKLISNRWVEYNRTDTKGAYYNANKLMTLTMSLLRHQNVLVELGKATIVRTWQADQMKDAELLVAALANAYSVQDGFNAVETGQTKHDGLMDDPYNVSEHRRYVYSQPYMERNLERSLAQIEQAKKAELTADIKEELATGKEKAKGKSQTLQQRVQFYTQSLEKRTSEVQEMTQDVKKRRMLHSAAANILEEVINLGDK
ncbi:hypothetical protein QBC40DRAFT_301115 [Triangularia verruculosa]|uniref:Uncharacterized protein n=1 Tax=Triangularia verruculosa TaxID=2587418 RepID=A0AAN6X7P1_9PEZI|nr:hypothetical protein QBC40DRAFT_301115 [Triangularia verruculosa]